MNSHPRGNTHTRTKMNDSASKLSSQLNRSQWTSSYSRIIVYSILEMARQSLSHSPSRRTGHTVSTESAKSGTKEPCKAVHLFLLRHGVRQTHHWLGHIDEQMRSGVRECATKNSNTCYHKQNSIFLFYHFFDCLMTQLLSMISRREQ